jgi:hypothetical protein
MAENDDFTAYVREAARLMGISLDAANVAAVTANFRNYRTLYDAIREFDPGDTPDPAAIYRP